MAEVFTQIPKETPKVFQHWYPLPEGWQHIGASIQNSLMYGARFRTADNDDCYLVAKWEYDVLCMLTRYKFAVMARGVRTAKDVLTPWFDTAEACFVYWAMTNQEEDV